MRKLLAVSLAFLAGSAVAEPAQLDVAVTSHILPGYQALATETVALAMAAEADCRPAAQPLRSAYHRAFDAWVRVSHLRFGPSEADDRAFGLAFWPDARGKTPKALAGLIGAEDPVISSASGMDAVSIAARGYYAMEFLLYDPAFHGTESANYHCALVRAVAADIAKNSAAILDSWRGGYAALMTDAGQNDTYRSQQEALRQLFTALSTGLEFTAQARLGRPMGTFERPRPKRAEARRSGRSLRQVILSLQATRQLAMILSHNDPALAAAYDAALGKAGALDDPVFAGVATPQGRLKVEVLQQGVEKIRSVLRAEVGPRLGIAAGFNSLDGD